MKKYMIQTLYMDAWDLGTFYIGEQLFLGVSQLGGKSFVIYKWDDEHRYIWLCETVLSFSTTFTMQRFSKLRELLSSNVDQRLGFKMPSIMVTKATEYPQVTSSSHG